MSRPTAALSEADETYSIGDRIVDDFAPTALYVAEAADLRGGSVFTAWRDHTGGGKDLTTVTGTAPTYDADHSGFANRPVLLSSGGYFESGSNFDAANDFTVMVVFNDAGTSSYEVLLDLGYSTWCWIGRDSTNANQWACGVMEGVPPYGAVITAADDTLPHVIVMKRTGTTRAVWVNGTEVASGAVSGAATTAAPLRLFGGPSGGNLNDGAIAVAGYWNSALSDANIKSLTHTLRAHYATTEGG